MDQLVAALARGPQGLRGPIPNHQVDGPRIRFQVPDGSYGAWLNTLGNDGPVGSARYFISRTHLSLSIVAAGIEHVYVRGVPYVVGTSAGPNAIEDAGGSWWELDLTYGFVHPAKYGFDDAAVNAALDDAKAYGKSLAFTNGDYTIEDELKLIHSGLHVLALGGACRFLHVGAGRAVSFDGEGVPSANPAGHTYQTFGGPNHFIIDGNPDTTDALYTKFSNHTDFRVKALNCACAFRAVSSVLNKYEVICSSNEDTAADFTTIPVVGIDAEFQFSCKWDMIIEGVGDPAHHAVTFKNSATNLITGTAEACYGGNLHLDVNCLRNKIDLFDAESGGAGWDYWIEGSYNNMVGSVGANTAAGSRITGTHNRLETSRIDSLHVVSTNGVNKLLDCILDGGGAFVDTDTSTRIRDCAGAADKN
jgi:hypothetical protein